MKKKREKLGDILLDLEKVVDRMVDQHELQFGDVLSLVLSHLQVHHPGAQETYKVDQSHPIFYYGPSNERDDVYEVWRSAPEGEDSKGLFRTRSDAITKAAEWNKELQFSPYKAIISQRRVRKQ